MKYAILSELGYWTGAGWSEHRSAAQWESSESDQQAKADRMRADGIDCEVVRRSQSKVK